MFYEPVSCVCFGNLFCVCFVNLLLCVCFFWFDNSREIAMVEGGYDVGQSKKGVEKVGEGQMED